MPHDQTTISTCTLFKSRFDIDGDDDDDDPERPTSTVNTMRDETDIATKTNVTLRRTALGGVLLRNACFLGNVGVADWVVHRFDVSSASDDDARKEFAPPIVYCGVGKRFYSGCDGDDDDGENRRTGFGALRSRVEFCKTLLMDACYSGRLGIVAWLFETVGLPMDMASDGEPGKSPIDVAFRRHPKSGVHGWLDARMRTLTPLNRSPQQTTSLDVSPTWQGQPCAWEGGFP